MSQHSLTADAVGAPATSTTDHVVSRDGLVLLRLHWAAAPPLTSPPPTAPPIASVLIVHGIGEHSGRYEHVGAAFAAAGFATEAFDQRGFGESGGRRGHVDRFDEYVDDVQDQLLELRGQGRPVVLLGHSMGGLVSLLPILQRRDACPDLLVLSAPALAAGAAADRVRPLARFLGPRLPRLRVHNPIDVESLGTDLAVRARYSADPLIATSGTLGLLRNVLEQIDWANAHLHRLDVPTLVVHGGDDLLVPTRASELLDALPGVTRWVEPGLRHELLNEPPWASLVERMIGWIADELGRG
jgi:acylglycerol lipase